MLPHQPNESLIAGLACLQAVASSRKPIGVRETARLLNLEPTRTHRLLKTLAHLGVVAQTAENKYISGSGMHVLAAQSIFASGLVRKSLPHLEALQQHGFLVAHGVLWKDQVSYFYHATPGMPVDQALGRVGLYPATCSSIGMVLLSKSTDKDIRQLYKGRDILEYANGIGTLLEDICEIRKKGFAKIKTGNGNVSIATTVGNPPHSAIALSGKIDSTEVRKYFMILKETAENIEKS
jgi:DNA-binding IclR family transcriptional regulator